MIELDRETIADFVAEALAEIPAELARAMSNVQVVVSDRNVDEPELLGLYEACPLPSAVTPTPGCCRTGSPSTPNRCSTCAPPCSRWPRRCGSRCYMRSGITSASMTTTWTNSAGVGRRQGGAPMSEGP